MEFAPATKLNFEKETSPEEEIQRMRWFLGAASRRVAICYNAERRE